MRRVNRGLRPRKRVAALRLGKSFRRSPTDGKARCAPPRNLLQRTQVIGPMESVIAFGGGYRPPDPPVPPLRTIRIKVRKRTANSTHGGTNGSEADPTKTSEADVWQGIRASLIFTARYSNVEAFPVVFQPMATDF